MDGCDEGDVADDFDEGRVPVGELGAACHVPCECEARTQDGRFFFSSRRRHAILRCDWRSDVCSSDLRRAITATRLNSI